MKEKMQNKWRMEKEQNFESWGWEYLKNILYQ